MRAVIFDLDGTLIDAAPDITAKLNEVLAADGLAPLTLLEVHNMIGDGAKVLVERAFAARGRMAQPRHLAH
ncbi:MAG: HAD hydrolase-like protein, partial [Rhodospirillales bacterium]|nr:HAD hydrolase-like protein [Rhodospirillales bacterium]